MPRDGRSREEDVDESDDASVNVIDTEQILKEKSLELKRFLKDIRAVLEEWKFSVEETKEGMRVEIRAVALINYPKRH